MLLSQVKIGGQNFKKEKDFSIYAWEKDRAKRPNQLPTTAEIKQVEATKENKKLRLWKKAQLRVQSLAK